MRPSALQHLGAGHAFNGLQVQVLEPGHPPSTSPASSTQHIQAAAAKQGGAASVTTAGASVLGLMPLVRDTSAFARVYVTATASNAAPGAKGGAVEGASGAAGDNRERIVSAMQLQAGRRYALTGERE